MQSHKLRIERLTINLHALIRQGQGDGAEAEAIREHIVDTWPLLAVEDQVLFNGLSGDLYMLAGDERLSPPEEATMSTLNYAREHHDWRRVLQLLTLDIPGVSPKARAVFRSKAWSELGYPLASAEFTVSD